MDGSWDLVITTPLGRQHVVLHLATTGGTLTGRAVGARETCELIEPEADGTRLRWRQRITRPLRLNLAFDVVVDGDTMTGTSTAGRLPASAVTGTRVAPG